MYHKSSAFNLAGFDFNITNTGNYLFMHYVKMKTMSIGYQYLMYF